MRAVPRIQTSNVSGLLDKVVGLGKEIFGELYDDDRLVEAGQAQQGKGTEKLEALRQEAKAEAHRRSAERAEAKERDTQAAKASKAS